ncbi:hypothetical protein [Marinifilum fragile]|uniref:hypothetical protein n=1 Tax=Marinifilum fragile TaxID=570161 RepID=UPI002AAAB69A|nr:hypothetical protein [Marinifilum fragile]
MKAYTLKKKDTNEYHIFEGEMYPPGGEYKCSSGRKSICEKMLKSESERNIFACKDEKEARKLCAEHGRKVCGTCVSHLYKTV